MAVVHESADHVESTLWHFSRGAPITENWEFAALRVPPGVDAKVHRSLHRHGVGGAGSLERESKLE